LRSSSSTFTLDVLYYVYLRVKHADISVDHVEHVSSVGKSIEIFECEIKGLVLDFPGTL